MTHWNSTDSSDMETLGTGSSGSTGPGAIPPTKALFRTDSAPEYAAPMVSAVIATRNRGAGLLPTVRAILEGSLRSVEVIVVDQSDDNATRSAIDELLPDTRIVYVRDVARGASHARNVGFRVARADVIAITDDDCIPSEDWAESLYRLFQQDNSLGLVFASVVGPPISHRTSAVPTFVPSRGRREQGLRGKGRRLEGIGANMAARRESLVKLGGFDCEFGPGSIRYSAEDLELHYRALKSGIPVAVVGSPVVMHLGVRSFGERWTLWQRDARSIGALTAHLWREGSPLTAMIAWYWYIGRITQAAFFHIVFFRYPTGVRLAAWTWWNSLCGIVEEVRRPASENGRTGVS